MLKALNTIVDYYGDGEYSERFAAWFNIAYDMIRRQFAANKLEKELTE